ncbi:hypothetical protein Sgou_16500 [Streptomyces gougerotii]|uniref:Molecular chaperone n=4 Tax=Streptomyces TaxID=1883 RepID=A0A8H9HIS5_9ACTN|nr:hypothetical protein Sgou_16500 [Streptomyces gougerotii]GGU66188.1 hypothetical protein GCM10010227_19810 [Streptomyces gougerotii]
MRTRPASTRCGGCWRRGSGARATDLGCDGGATGRAGSRTAPHHAGIIARSGTKRAAGFPGGPFSGRPTGPAAPCRSSWTGRCARDRFVGPGRAGACPCAPDAPAPYRPEGKGTFMAWLLVIVAGLLETGFAVCLKLSHGFTRLWPTIAFAAFALGSFGLLTLALKRLDVGPAYAVWTGIGAAGTAIYGMVFLGDVVSTLKIISITLVICGVIGLQLSGSAQ